MTATILTPFGLVNTGLSNSRMSRTTSNTDYAATTAHDLVQTNEHAYRLSVLAPGVIREQLEVQVHDRRLSVKAKPLADSAEVTYLHHGISRHALDFTFVLAEHVTVTDAQFENGLLHIDLVREVPEALQPRSIEVKGSHATAQVADQQAA